MKPSPSSPASLADATSGGSAAQQGAPGLEYWTARAITGEVAAGRLSPVEVTEYFLARIESLEPQLNAFVTLDADAARQTARDREKHLRSGGAPGALEGIPLGIKDLVPTKGLRTTNGMKFWQDEVPAFDGVEVERIRAAGAIIVGKTNTPALGHKDVADNLVSGATHNPWRRGRTPGGSSGGAGAAVAAGYGPIAHGTDGAGSVRIPAAWSGVFGMKPSMGRIPLWPAGDSWDGRVQVGALARDVRDAALMIDVMAGPDARDPLSLAASGETLLAACEQPLRGQRLAFSTDLGFAPMSDEVAALVTDAVAVFEGLGCEIVPLETPWPDPTSWHTTLFRGGIAARLKPYVEAHPEWIDDTLMEAYELGRAITAEEYVNARFARTLFYQWANDFMSGYDGLLTPTMPVGAWPIADPSFTIGDKEVSHYSGGRWPLVYLFNVTGWPAASVPCGFTGEGLPVGLQVVTPWRQDAACFSLCAAFEAARPWAQLPFPV